MTLSERAATAGVWTVASCAAVFLLTPLVVTVIVSFGSSAIFTLPPPDWSFRWYERLTHLRGLTSSLWTSVQIAALSTFISMVLGVLAAIALARGRFPGREAIAAFLTSPLMLPGLVLGISLAIYLATLWIVPRHIGDEPIDLGNYMDRERRYFLGALIAYCLLGIVVNLYLLPTGHFDWANYYIAGPFTALLLFAWWSPRRWVQLAAPVVGLALFGVYFAVYFPSIG